jgi:hypothetical protein
MKILWVIWSTSVLILLRTVFRLAETAQGMSPLVFSRSTATYRLEGREDSTYTDSQGFFGYASTHEWLFAILEYLPVILALLIWAIWPPCRLMPVVDTGAERVESRDRVEKRGEALQAV